uniref:Osteoclast-stimulating factor 1 n=1 Tax=Gasterosteus aculeatus aculeatus TaxID=481459 RepID=A0AAQ4QLB6_GASAC
MELWRQCAMWLIDCRVLPENHRVTWEGAQVCDLAQTLRDGVLLCQLLNNLLPQAVNLREINLRPQMSQFLCLKNIRTFLGVCQEKFHLKKSELFEAFDLFDVRDFAKVDPAARPLPPRPPVTWGGKADTVDGDDDLYDCVEDEENEGDEIYEDLMRTDEHANTVSQQGRSLVSLRNQVCCYEIQATEVRTQTALAQSGHVLVVICSEPTHRLPPLRLLLYGHYCSQVEAATKHLDKLSNTREDIRMKLEECSNRANSRRFSLRDLLMVPIQRVLKYHLLLQELLKHTTDPAEKDNLRKALDAMRDLAQCVNEVKRDNEIIRQITTFQLSIENMTQSLAFYGRPKIDGELKICSPEKKSKQDRYAFLFDKAMFICKKKSGETFELKEIIELQYYQLRDETTGEKDNKKVFWSYLFLLLELNGRCGYDLFFKTRELKKKWLEQFQMSLSNMCPDNSTANNHDFQMNCFEDTTSCKACSMLLRGIFFQGYRCSRCKMAAHKECLESSCTQRSFCIKISRSPLPSSSLSLSGYPKMEVCQEYYGLPPPPVGFGQPLPLCKGDIIELTRAEADLSWWEVANLTIGQMGWFPGQNVQPYISVSTKPDPTLFSRDDPFAGNMDRTAARNLLVSRSDGTFLVRQKDGGEFAISIKFNMDVRHIKVTSTEGLYRINDKKAFKGLVEMIQFYQQNSLKEYFKDLDTTLCTPYKQPEQSYSPDHTPHNAAHTAFSTNSSQEGQWGGRDLLPSAVLSNYLTLATFLATGGGARSFSAVRARYDFSARDRSELSLREGDTIKILSKKGHSGWWKGEVYGRVGFFPANYVEEDYSEYC